MKTWTREEVEEYVRQAAFMVGAAPSEIVEHMKKRLDADEEKWAKDRIQEIEEEPA